MPKIKKQCGGYEDKESYTIELNDTRKLQLASLDAFAQQLGYIRCPATNSYLEAWCESPWDTTNHKGQEVVSFTRMQKLHNRNFLPSSSGLFSSHSLEHLAPREGFCLESAKSAIEAKLVVATKFQRKKNGELVLQDHQIRFV